MAKPKVYKVSDSLKLKDLFHARKLSSGDRVCLLLPLKPKARHTKRKFKFVRGTLSMSYRSYCECCGPCFSASIEKADGTVLKLCDDFGRNDYVLH